MNREIKFRAFLWSDEHTNDQMIFSDEIGMLNFWSNYLHWQDKKAIKEIYEGDVVQGKLLVLRWNEVKHTEYEDEIKIPPYS